LASYLVPVVVAPPVAPAPQLFDMPMVGETLFAELVQQADVEEDAQDLQDARETAERYRRGGIDDFTPYVDYRRQR